jgi:rubrerythrin
MISKADIIKYLNDLMLLEEEMMQTYSELSQQVHDPEIKSLLSQLAKEELGHKKEDEALIHLLETS